MVENYLVQTSNYVKKILNAITLSLKKLLSYVVNNALTLMNLFVLGTFET